MTEKSDRKPSVILPVALAALVLLAGYVGAYYATVSQMSVSSDRGNVWQLPFYSASRLASSMESRTAWAERLRVFFTPIHWLDRRIRAHLWEPK